MSTFTKQILRIFLVPAILIFVGNNLSAQKKQIGIDVGFGKTETQENNPHIRPFGENNQNLGDYFRIGFCYQYTPKKVFSFSTGMYYDHRSDIDQGIGINAAFLRVPAGIELSVGQRFQLVLGFGLYSGVLISYNGSEEPNKLNLGFQGNVGIAFELSTKVNFEITYQKDYDITKFYTYYHRSPGGAEYSAPFSGYDGFLNLSLKFDLMKK